MTTHQRIMLNAFAIREVLSMLVIDRGFALAGPIKRYWLFQDEVFKVETVGLK